MNKNVTIVGSGLAGPLLGILLAQKYNIRSNMYERNQDFKLSLEVNFNAEAKKSCFSIFGRSRY